MGTLVPPGEHEVVLRFRPPGWTAGLAVTAVSAAVLLALGLVAWRRRTISAGTSSKSA